MIGPPGHAEARLPTSPGGRAFVLHRSARADLPTWSRDARTVGESTPGHRECDSDRQGGDVGLDRRVHHGAAFLRGGTWNGGARLDPAAVGLPSAPVPQPRDSASLSRSSDAVSEAEDVSGGDSIGGLADTGEERPQHPAVGLDGPPGTRAIAPLYKEGKEGLIPGSCGTSPTTPWQRVRCPQVGRADRAASHHRAMATTPDGRVSCGGIAAPWVRVLVRPSDVIHGNPAEPPETRTDTRRGRRGVMGAGRPPRSPTIRRDRGMDRGRARWSSGPRYPDGSGRSTAAGYVGAEGERT